LKIISLTPFIGNMIKSIQHLRLPAKFLSWHKALLFALFVTTSLVLISCVISPRDDSAELMSSQPVSNSNPAQESDPLAYEFAAHIESPLLPKSVNGNSVSVASISELIEILKENGIWNLGPMVEVSPLLVNSFPADLDKIDVNIKKRVFFNALLPVVMAVQDEIRAERQQLSDILAKFPVQSNSITFSDDNPAWQKMLSGADVTFVKKIAEKYRHENGAELFKRINVLPVSLVLAQGAIESSWGTSRFANMGNNLFGMWTWGEEGIVPLKRTAGKTHKLAVYDSILESVRAYLLTINRIPAYERLRTLRGQSMDPIVLSKGLLYYSERRHDYVADLQRIINFNKLVAYDRYRLSLSSNI
jgi:Bax protein